MFLGFADHTIPPSAWSHVSVGRVVRVTRTSDSLNRNSALIEKTLLLRQRCRRLLNQGVVLGAVFLTHLDHMASEDGDKTPTSDLHGR